MEENRMRTLLIALSLSLLCGVARAESGPQVPDAVQMALVAKYNIAEATNWVVSQEDGKKVWCTR
jgi:hypothetical protein